MTTVQIPSVTTEETSFTNEFVAIDLTEDIDELDILIDSLTPQAIHAYFQQKKMELLKKPIEVIIKEPSYEWVTNNGVYRSDQESLRPIEDKENFYAIINPDLASKLDTNLLAQFSTALSKGLITKMHKSKGIKIIPNKLIELKINDDNRLYTDHIYRNPQGKYLIDFDQHGRHKDVERILSKSHLQIIECIPHNFLGEGKEAETSYLPQHITKEMEYVSVSEEEVAIGLSVSGNYDVDWSS